MQIIMLGPSLNVNGGITSVEKLILQYMPSDVKIRHIATHVEGSLVSRIAVFSKAIIKVLFTLLGTDINLVHIHISQRGSVYRQAILAFLVWLFRKPIVIHAHGSEFTSFYLKLQTWQKKIFNWIFSKSSRFLVLSESWKKFYINNLGLQENQIIILPNPVKLPLEVPIRLEKKQLNFIFLGRICQRKGAFDLIKAFANLNILAQKEVCCLTLAGDGEIEKAQQLIESLNLTNHIHLTGWVAQEERDNLLAKADIFVLPSYNEGLPMALLEAMGWGLPVITTPVGGISEVINTGENGLLFNPGNIQQLSDSMNALAKNKGLRDYLGNNARASVTPLDINKYSVSLRDIYRLVP